VREVKPSTFIIAETAVTPDLDLMLNHLGAADWNTDATTDGELLVEVAGRMCYKSFGVGLNPNVTRVREGNRDYIGNVLKVKHGSVFEHASTTVAFCDVSRIFTHELVRHRAGTAISQESMRFVRLDDIPIYIPALDREFEQLAVITLEGKTGFDPKSYGKTFATTFFNQMTEMTLKAQELISEWSQFLDHPKVPFKLKKAITSALRRMAPGGHATNVILTANHRAWRHLLELRTALTPDGDLTAEVEIHDVMMELGKKFKAAYPNFYQDMEVIDPLGNGNSSCIFANSKV
jgi:thymidylate synthase (FAD)